MKIGIKYCGGCNPRFERASIAARLREDFPEATIVSALQGPADVVAVICGCLSACAYSDAPKGAKGTYVIAGPEEYETLRRLLAETEKGA